MADSDTWTVQQVLQAAGKYLISKDIDQHRLESELLLAHALGTRRIDLYLQFDRPLQKEEREAYKGLLRRRAAREPTAYIIGQKEFYGLPFVTTPEVLIPRPETEILVDTVLAVAKQRPLDRFLDIGTGSGCIAVALLNKLPEARAVATDISLQALRLAALNGRNNGVGDRLDLVCGDLGETLCAGPYAAVITNPPYIDRAETEQLQREIVEYEPHAALFSEESGLEHSRRLALWLDTHLAEDGFALVECADQRAEQTLELFRSHLRTRRELEIICDLSGLPRAVWVGASPPPKEIRTLGQELT